MKNFQLPSLATQKSVRLMNILQSIFVNFKQALVILLLVFVALEITDEIFLVLAAGV